MELVHLKEAVNSSIDKALVNVFENQYMGTFWQGDIYYNAYPTAVAIITNKILGITEPEWENKAAYCIMGLQRRDGSWGILDKQALPLPNLDEDKMEEMLELKSAAARNTIVCILALELLDVYPECVAKGKEYMKTVDEKYIDPFTEIFLACFGRKKWKDIKVPPIEMMLIPVNSKFGFNRFLPAWVRDGAAGGILLKTLRQKKGLWSPIRRMAIKKAEKMLLNNQLSNGGWFGTFQPTVYPTLALAELGHDLNSDVIQRALGFLQTRRREENGYVHRFWLPVWDTSFTLLALASAGLTDSNHNVAKAKYYIINSQFRNGSWGFCPEVNIYPDCDDTAVAMQALSKLGLNKDYLMKSAEWLERRQNKDGGWAAFIKEQAKKTPGTLPTTIEDSMVILKDPSVADVTGHVMIALGEVGYRVGHPSIDKAISFLKKDQLQSGAWYGRWGLCYIYAVTRVLKALQVVGEDMNSDYVQKAIKWLVEHQNSDGGWGECYVSYFKEEYAGIGMSTAVHTSWALTTLIAVAPKYSSAIEKGAKYILETQCKDGNWPSPHTVGALEVYENTNYSRVFPLMALGEYRKFISKGGDF